MKPIHIFTFAFCTFFLLANMQAQVPFQNKKKEIKGPEKQHQQKSVKPDFVNPGLYRTLPPLTRSKNSNAVVNSGTSHQKQKLDIAYAPESGMPISIRGFKHSNKSANDSRVSQKAAAFDFLEAIQDQICVEEARTEFGVISHSDTEEFKHLKFQQYYKTLPVYGSQLIVHISPEAELSLNGRSQPSPVMESVEPTWSVEQAKEVAIAELSQKTLYKQMSEKELEMLDYHGPESELVIYPYMDDFGSFHLAYHLTLRPNFLEVYEYFVDANTGEIINSYNHTCSFDGSDTAQATDLNGNTRTINTYDYNGTFYMYDASREMYNGPDPGLPKPGDGGIETLDLGGSSYANPQFEDITSSNNVWSGQSIYPNAVSAHYNAGLSYEYYRTVHNRNSINGQGGDIISFINVTDENGSQLDNAFWNGQYMFYGNGDQVFKPLAGALDVAGHEMSHGVIQNTANLEYQGESGAINESMADVFGVLIDWGDWKLGEDIIANTNAFPTGCLRDMSDPHNGGSSIQDVSNGWQPDHYDERYTGSQDNGGVHINSGIPNKAFYLIASSIGKEKTEQIYYRALTQYLTRSSKFIDLRLAVVQAAGEINGVTTANINVVKNAFDQVGVLNGDPTPIEETIEENEGEEWIISLDTDDNNQTRLYLSTIAPTSNDDYQALSESNITRKPSISDDGCDLYFVDANTKSVKYINLCANSIETKVTIPGYSDDWYGVAVSKDGSKIALNTVFENDNFIYVYNTINNQVEAFELYSPTFTEGIQTNTVKYADAMEWDYTGQYVIYDAYNVIAQTGDDDYDFWDMAILKAWDNSTNDFDAEGQITQIFSNLPEGVSIGNPTFSKNSPSIFAFDFWDTQNNQLQLKAVNLETGDVGTIVEDNDILSYASYSKDDSQIVYSSLDGDGTNWVYRKNLDNNKIEAASNANVTELIPVAEWPLWIAQGNRLLPTGVDEVSPIAVHFSIAPNPVSNWFKVNLVPNVKAEISIYNLDGRLMKQIPEAAGNAVEIDASNWSTGSYVVKVQSKDWIETSKLIKIQ